MADGARTHEHWNHNPGLYQLSYSHRSKNIVLMGINPKLHSSIRCWADQYCPNGAPGRIRTCDHPLRRRVLYPAELRAHAGITFAGQVKSGRSGGIRTPDILLPKQTRYRAALHSDCLKHSAFQVVRILTMRFRIVNEKNTAK